MSSATLDFFYDFASTYSYLAAMRIGRLAEAAGVQVRWKPFLLGPILKAQGYDTSPFNRYPEKGANMWRDMDRLAVRHGLPAVTRPKAFPANALLGARVATALNDACRPSFTQALFRAEFAEGRDIAQRETVREVLAGLGHFCDTALTDAEGTAAKERLRAVTQEAQALGIFGAPSFVTADRDIFWGNDRLEMALEHAVALAGRPRVRHA